MKQKMIKKTGILLLFFFITGTNLFAQSTVGITNSMSVADVSNNIQNAITGATSGDIITVTGSKTDEEGMIQLNIPANITVVWSAESEGLSFNIDGGGTFGVAEGGKIEATGSNCVVIFVNKGNVTVSGGRILGFGQNVSVIEVNNGNIAISGGEIIADGDDWGYAYTVCVNISGTIAVTGGSVLSINAMHNVVIYAGGGLAAYLKGTCDGIFQTYGTSIIVEVESLNIPSSYGGTNDGLTRKEGNAITAVKWDVSGTVPLISFNNGAYTIEWKAPATEPPVTPTEDAVRLQETGDLFKTLNEGIAAAKTLGYSAFTLEVIGDVTETSDVIIGSEDITIVGAEGKHTFAFTKPSSGFKFAVQGGGSLILGDGMEANLLTILHSVSVTNGEIIVNDGVKLDGGLLLSGTTATGSITGGRFEGPIALKTEKGATISEISGGVFIGANDVVYLSDLNTRIEKISGGAFYQKGTYEEIGKSHGHVVFVQNAATIGEISGGYFEATANCAMMIVRGGWVDKISNGEFVAKRPGTTREPSDDQWNAVIHIETRAYEGYLLSGIGTISGGHFHGGAHFGMLLITNGTGTAQVNEITGGFFEGEVGIQNDVGGHIGTISGGKIYGGQGMLSVSTIGKITGDADIRGTSSYGIFNYSGGGWIGEISGGKIISNNSHGIQNSGAIGTISGGTITSVKGSSHGINNSSQIDKITGGTITSEQYGNGISNSGTINEISGGKITGGLGTAPMFTGDISGNGIFNSGSITRISGGTVIGYKNAINCVGSGSGGFIHTISNGVFWGRTKLAINLAKTVFLEPKLDAVIGFGRYWGKDGEIFNDNDLVEFPDNYHMSNRTMAVKDISEVEFKYLRQSCLRGITSIIWTPEANTGSDKQNWNNIANWTPAIVPTMCYDVYIPGNSTHYPQLESYAECDNIYFMQGGELGRPDWLNYNQAFVHLNMGLVEYSQTKETDLETLQNLIFENGKTAERMIFSASTSQPLTRERWYALSSPLRSVASGDLSFGGFPLTFMKRFGPVTKDNVTYPVGQWTTPYNSMKEVFSPTEGFGFYAYGYGNSTGNNTGCLEFGSYNDMNDMNYFPERNGRTYGNLKTNGILELPFFADSLSMDAHRTQVYDDLSGNSTMYYISDGTAGLFGMITGKTDVVQREDNHGNYRFIAEEYKSGKWEFQKQIYHPVNGLKSGDEFLVGNPYMSSIDMLEFCKDNISTIEPEFRIWNGITFTTYSINTSADVVTSTVPGNLGYVAPLQGFFLTYKGGDVLFDVEKISTVRPAGTSSNLRSAAATKEENILRIKAENNLAASYAVIGYREEASNDFVRGRDVQKLFSPYNYVPEVYSLAGKVPADINYIDHAVETLIPLGIKTNQLGNVTLTFTGMDNYDIASKIVLKDMLLNKETDLSGQSSYTYTFDNQVAGAQNDRFFILFGAAATSLPSLEKNEYIQIYSNSSGILVHTPASDPIRSIQVYDLQGRKLYEETFSGINTHQIPDNYKTRCVIIRVKTNEQVKSEKIVLNR